MPPSALWKQVKDPHGHWYDAKIVGERGEGEEREVKVHYHGWKFRALPYVGTRRRRVGRSSAGRLMFAAALQLGQSTASPQRGHLSVRMRASFRAASALALTFGRPLGVGLRPQYA